jgi:hypothetical protein
MHPVIPMIPFRVGILNVVCKVNLISLIDFTDGCCVTDIICACLSWIALITTDGGLVRVTINSHLDTIEHNIIQELDDTEDKIKSKINNLLTQLSQNSKTVEVLQSDIIAFKEYASDIQTFLGSKIIEEEVKKNSVQYCQSMLMFWMF